MAANVEFETTLHMGAPIRLNCSRMHTFAHDCSHDDGGRCSTRAATRTSSSSCSWQFEKTHLSRTPSFGSNDFFGGTPLGLGSLDFSENASSSTVHNLSLFCRSRRSLAHFKSLTTFSKTFRHDFVTKPVVPGDVGGARRTKAR
jgi:hypothetical protein